MVTRTCPRVSSSWIMVPSTAGFHRSTLGLSFPCATYTRLPYAAHSRDCQKGGPQPLVQDSWVFSRRGSCLARCVARNRNRGHVNICEKRRRMFFNKSSRNPLVLPPLLLLLLLALLPQATPFLRSSSIANTLRWRGGSSAGIAVAGASMAATPEDVMIGRGPQEPVRPFVPDLLEGRKALVTGGNRGIGEAITVALVKAGAKVCVMAGNEEAYHAMVERNGLDDTEGTGNVCWVKADLRKPAEAIAGAHKAVEWAGGSMDILVNNAGICVLEDFMDISSDSFDETIAINTRAPLLVSQVCLEGMIKKKYGKIVNITSQSAVIATKAHAAYCASKAAMDGLLHGLVCDLSQHNIQVNNIAPTVAWSDMGLKTWGDPAKSQPMLDKTPIGRFVEPWEIANMVVFLSSDACTMCLGQTICVDGGYTCL